ncbi:hypothetical protein KUCAC02_030790, partial [Chaenocephalus aceratus]
GVLSVIFKLRLGTIDLGHVVIQMIIRSRVAQQSMGGKHRGKGPVRGDSGGMQRWSSEEPEREQDNRCCDMSEEAPPSCTCTFPCPQEVPPRDGHLAAPLAQ